MAHQLFYIGQKAFIEKDGEVLTLQHKNGLDFPGGRINDDTLNFSEELQREVREETGLEIEVGDPFTIWHTNKKIEDHYIFLVGYRCRYVSGEVVLSEEHTDYKWVNRDSFHEIDKSEFYLPALQKYFELK